MPTGRVVRALTGLTVLVAHLRFAVPALADASPLEQLRSSFEHAAETLSASVVLSSAERRRRLQEICDARFGFVEMAKRALGRHWSPRTPAERDKFLTVFRDAVRDRWILALAAHRPERVKYTGEMREARFARIMTVMLDEKGLARTFEYRLYLADAQWKVYDILVEGISVVHHYRSQFERVLARSSFSELLSRMRVGGEPASGTGEQQTRERMTMLALLAQLPGTRPWSLR